MIKHLLVYGCEDKYSQGPIRCLYQKTDLSPPRRQEVLDHYRSMLNNRVITVLHIVEFEVDSTDGLLKVVFNELGKVEPRKRIVINPPKEGPIKVVEGDLNNPFTWVESA